MRHLNICKEFRNSSQHIFSVVLFFSCLLFLTFSNAQKPYFLKSDKYSAYGKYAYADSLNPSEPIYKWDDVRKFEKGIAWVYIFKKESFEHLWGLIDSKGNYIFEPRYSSFLPFYNNFSRVTLKGKYGFINLAGTEITKIIYDTATSFSEGLAVVRLKKKWKIIDTNGNIINEIEGNYAKIGDFKDGMCQVTNKDGFDGYIDASGKEIIPCIYLWAHSFKNGKASVEKIVDHFGKTKRGIIDKKGNVVIPFKYDGIYDFKDGFAKVSNAIEGGYRRDSIYGLVSENGSEIIAPRYSDLRVLFSKWISVVKRDEWGNYKRELRDLNGKLISNINFNIFGYEDGYTVIKLNDKYAVYGKDGKELIPFKYDSISKFNNGIALAKSGSKWGYINAQDSVIFPFRFEAAFPFLGDSALVILNGKKYNVYRGGSMKEFRLDSTKFTYTTYPNFVYGNNLLGKWHIISINGNKENLFYDYINRVEDDLFIAKNETSYILFVNDKFSIKRISIPLPIADRIVKWFGYKNGNKPFGITLVKGKFGMYSYSYETEIPAGFNEYYTDGSNSSFKLDGKWYEFDFFMSDFNKRIYKLKHKCDACNGAGGTATTTKIVSIPGRKYYVPSKTESVKKWGYVTLPNGEKSNFRTYEYYENKTVPGYYAEEPSTIKKEYIPGIKCNKCKGLGNLSVEVKWTGSEYVILMN